MNKFKVLLVYPNVPGSSLLPIGIASLSASLKQSGFEVELFDCTFYNDSSMYNFEQKKVELLQVKPFKLSWDYLGDEKQMVIDFQKMVNDYKPNLIGISLVEDTIDQGLSLLNSIKGSEISVIAGGVGVNWNQDRLFDSGLIDCICIGEGEQTFVEICYVFKKYPNWIGTAWFGIAGSIWKDSCNEILKSRKTKSLLDVNKLPVPDFSLFGEKRITRIMHGKEYRMIQIEVDRGCPYQCTYCCAPALKKMYGKGYYRRKSESRILAEIKELSDKYYPDYFDFNSETFLARPEDEITHLLAQYGGYFKIPFWCQARPEDITRDKIKFLKGAGVADFQLGIEHGNAGFRNKWLKRKGSNIQIKESCELLTEYEIPFTINIILFPNLDTRETIFDGINLCREIDSKYLKTINVYHLALYKGTWLQQYYFAQGWIDEGDKTNQLLSGSSTLKYIGLSKDEILGLQRTFLLYVRLKDMDDEIKKAEKMDTHGNRSFQSLSEIYRIRFYNNG